MGRKKRVGIAVAVAAAGALAASLLVAATSGLPSAVAARSTFSGDNSGSATSAPRRSTRWSPRASRPSASTRSATRRSGATRCTSTRPSPERRTAVSAPGVSPKTALSVGLKVDVDALPGARSATAHRQRPGQPRRPGRHADPAEAQLGGRRQGLLRPQTAAQLGRHRVRAVPLDRRRLASRRASATGWTAGPTATSTSVRSSACRPTCSRSPTLLHTDVATVHKVLDAWGPGKFDAELFLDGKAFQPDGTTAATLIPPAFGLAGVNLHTWTGWGSIPYWNAFVAILEMHGQGTFFDPRLDDANAVPDRGREQLRARQGSRSTWSVPSCPRCRPTSSSLARPEAAEGVVRRGGGRARQDAVQRDRPSARPATCRRRSASRVSTCTRASEIGIDNFEADRSPTHMYRTSPLAGLWSHQKGGFYHDGRFPDLRRGGRALRHHVPPRADARLSRRTSSST